MCWIANLLVAVGSGRVITSSSRCRKQWNRVVSVRFPRPWTWTAGQCCCCERATEQTCDGGLSFCRDRPGRREISSSVRGAASRDGLSFARGVAWTAIPAPVAGTMRTRPLASSGAMPCRFHFIQVLGFERRRRKLLTVNWSWASRESDPRTCCNRNDR
jgi:hypothetical protein